MDESDLIKDFGASNYIKDYRIATPYELPRKFPKFKKITTGGGRLPEGLSLDYDSRALDKLSERAISQADSPWAALQRQAIERQGIQGLDQATRVAQMRARAMAPKLSEEGAAVNLMRERLNLGTQAAGQTASQDLGVTLTDTKDKFGTLKSLPGMEVMAMKPEQFNIRNAMNELRALRNYRDEAWKQGMAWEGAQRTSEAMR
jgi:hypothetical protein